MHETQFLEIQSRRRFLERTLSGLGTAALAHLLQVEGRAAPHHKPTAKNVIFLFMEGAPSQLELFDPKPALKKWDGQALPDSMTRHMKLAFIKPTSAAMASRRTFHPRGHSGIEISDALPHVASLADDMCLIRSMHSDAFNHHPAQLLLMSGSMQHGRPSVGAWALYGLGSESQNLPGFVVLGSTAANTMGGSSNWTSGFLPSTYQGVHLHDTGEPITFLTTPPGISRDQQLAVVRAVGELNRENQRQSGDLEIASRIASYELAFRMQASAPELLDFSKEPAHIREMYGIDKEPMQSYARNCLLARRMVERGVRFVLLVHSSWDDHINLDSNLARNCSITDQPAAALVKDLKQRGLLDSTLVIWGGEFGRTPLSENRQPTVAGTIGRDHHPSAYSLWLAGGGIRRGQVIGETDELCLSIQKDPVHIHDLQATLLHCLGLDHTRLTYRHMGRDFRLTDVGGTVVQKMLA